MARTTVKTYSLDEIKDAFAALLEGGVAPAKKGRAAKDEVEPDEDEYEDDEEEEDDEDEAAEELDREEVEAMGVKDLRALAEKLGLKEKKLKSGILAELEKKGYYGEEDEVEDEDLEEEDGDEEDEDEEEGYTREELEEMGLPALKKILRENEIKVPRGADQDTLIDLILEEDEEEEEEEEADEEETEEEDGEEEAVLSEDDLKSMALTDLRNLAKELEIKVRIPKTATTDAKKRKAYVDAIMATAEDDD